MYGGGNVSAQISHIVPLTTPLFIMNILLDKFPSPLADGFVYFFVLCLPDTVLNVAGIVAKIQAKRSEQRQTKWNTEGAKPCHLGLINIRLQLAVLAALPTLSLSHHYIIAKYYSSLT